jgi:RNA polymerase sigma-70 factor (ECF subfamily)
MRLAARSWRVAMPRRSYGGPGALFLDGQQRVIGVLALAMASGQITSLRSIVNPDKLTHLGAVADLAALLRSARLSGSANSPRS